MDETQIIAGLLATLTTVSGGIVRYLTREIEKRDKTIEKQGSALEKQAGAQAELIAVQAALLRRGLPTTGEGAPP